jgi:hypothetical protein
VNTDAPWPDAEAAGQRGLKIQTKLHQWAKVADWHGHGESRMRRDPHVRFGGRSEETGGVERPVPRLASTLLAPAGGEGFMMPPCCIACCAECVPRGSAWLR